MTDLVKTQTRQNLVCILHLLCSSTNQMLDITLSLGVDFDNFWVNLGLVTSDSSYMDVNPNFEESSMLPPMNAFEDE